MHGPKDDIDTLIVGSEYIDRSDHFFGSLVEIFQHEPGITSLVVCHF